jgi:hypothetical protein
MSTLDELPPDQRAALSLLLAQRKSYGEVAAMLQIGEGAVHARAHAALAVLAPAQARPLTAEQRALVGDYLLGQLGVAERVQARTLLSSSEPARAWALAISPQLSTVAPQGLPDVPALNSAAPAAGPAQQPTAGAPPAAPGAGESPVPGSEERVQGGGSGPGSPSPAPASSRLGGALVLAAILVAVIVAVVLLTSGDSSHGGHQQTGTTTAASATTTTGPAVSARIAMRPAHPTSRSIGLLEILTEGSKRAFYIVAEHLPPTHGFFYALWLYNNHTSHEPLGKAPAVGSTERLEGGGALPANAAEFHEVLLTRETSTHATHPGRVVLRGAFTLGG